MDVGLCEKQIANKTPIVICFNEAQEENNIYSVTSNTNLSWSFS